MSYLRKPTTVVDIIKRTEPHQRLSARVNLRSVRGVIEIPLVKTAKLVIVGMAVMGAMFGYANAPTGNFILAAENSGEEREALERQLRELEAQIVEYESTINQYRRQGVSLKSEINTLESKIAKIQLQIKATSLSIERLDAEISETSEQITKTEGSIEENKENLASILQSVYETDSAGLLEVMLKNPRLSDFVSDVNNLMLVQDKLRVTLRTIIDLRNNLVDQRETLAMEKTDKEALKKYQDSQRFQVDKVKAEKDTLLKVTQGQESKYQQLLKETKKTAAEIRSRIFRLLGGGELTFEAAYELARFAEQATGIRAALILAVLDQESALGRNVGSCNYQTAMHPTRDIPAFMQITAELNIDPGSVRVSCPITAHGAYGGAMGPAQFIPSTWNLYKEDIARVTGNNPPNPWRNADAFVATALYLRDSYNSNSCRRYVNDYRNIVSEQVLGERCAAAQYYSGGNWWNYRWVYGEPVVERANRFQQDIDVLNAS